MPGVVSSSIGHLESKEIVRVEYDPAQINLDRLVKALKEQSSFDSLVVKNEAQRDQAKKVLRSSEIDVIASEPAFVESKHSLRTQSPHLYYLDLTEEQAIVLNSWSYFGGSMPDVLTAEQKRMLPFLQAKLAKQAPPFVPARSGAELESYRRKLRDWLTMR